MIEVYKKFKRINWKLGKNRVLWSEKKLINLDEIAFIQVMWLIKKWIAPKEENVVNVQEHILNAIYFGLFISQKF